MRSLSVNTDEITAIQQLDALLPSDQRSQITIVSAPPSNHFSISTQAIELSGRQRYLESLLDGSHGLEALKIKPPLVGVESQ
jgi:hypothetical protein